MATSGGRPLPSFAHATFEIARKEFLQLLRTKRLLGLGITILAAMVLLTLVIPLIIINVTGDLDAFADDDSGEAVDDVPYLHNGVMLFFLGAGIFLVSGYGLFEMLAIVMTADAVSSEWSRRTVFLVLSKPVPRHAFVLGKFLGIGVPLAVLVGTLIILDYLFVTILVPGWPAWNEVGRFFGAAGMIMLGVLMWSAIALAFSTMFRSTAAGLLTAILSWFVIFPLLGAIQFFLGLFGGDWGILQAGQVTWSTYLNPRAMMAASSDVLIPQTGEFFGFFAGSPGGLPEWWAALIAMVVHTVVFLVAAMVIVQARNFE